MNTQIEEFFTQLWSALSEYILSISCKITFMEGKIPIRPLPVWSPDSVHIFIISPLEKILLGLVLLLPFLTNTVMEAHIAYLHVSKFSSPGNYPCYLQTLFHFLNICVLKQKLQDLLYQLIVQATQDDVFSRLFAVFVCIAITKISILRDQQPFTLDT